MAKRPNGRAGWIVTVVAGLFALTGCVTGEEPGSSEAADTDCTGAALDDGGYCRMPNGQFAAASCCVEHPAADLDGKVVAYTLLETELLNVCVVEIKPDDAARVGLVEWGNDIPECTNLGPYMNDDVIGTYVHAAAASLEPVTGDQLDDLQVEAPDQEFYWVGGALTVSE